MLCIQLLEFVLQLVEVNHFDLRIAVVILIIFKILQSLLVQVGPAVDIFPEYEDDDLHAEETYKEDRQEELFHGRFVLVAQYVDPGVCAVLHGLARVT